MSNIINVSKPIHANDPIARIVFVTIVEYEYKRDNNEWIEKDKQKVITDNVCIQFLTYP